jgi:hypothetical protein
LRVLGVATGQTGSRRAGSEQFRHPSGLSMDNFACFVSLTAPA